VLEPGPDGARLRIGKPGEALPHGGTPTRSRIRSDGQVRFLDRHDELQWRSARRSASPRRSCCRSACRRARSRPTAGKEAQSFVRDGRAAFRSLRAIAPHEEVMVVVRFPKNVVERPKAGPSRAARGAGAARPRGRGALPLQSAFSALNSGSGCELGFRVRQNLIRTLTPNSECFRPEREPEAEGVDSFTPLTLGK
jgi:hypothetical protein